MFRKNLVKLQNQKKEVQKITHLLSTENAVRETLKYMRTKLKYRWSNLTYINKGRYCIVCGIPNIAILLKSEPFRNFGYKFKDQGQSGMGESINSEHLEIFEKNNVHGIYIIYRDGRLYYIPLEDFKKHSFKWTQKEGTTVMSISINKLMRVNEDE